MKNLLQRIVFTLFVFVSMAALADNQTPTTSPILPGQNLPFQVVIEQMNFSLPVGLHSGALGVYQGQWVIIAGRMNGLHGFGGDPFPRDQENDSIYVVNPKTGSTMSRSLREASAGLNQAQIDSLATTSPEYYQDGDTLYMIGGYGVETATGKYFTVPTLTAINLPGIVKWVASGNPAYAVVKNIKQINNSLFQVAGGALYKVGNDFQLVFGQDYEGVYTTIKNGVYTEQVRSFRLALVNGQLSVTYYKPTPQVPDLIYRRRDLNVLPTLMKSNNTLQPGLVAYSGVFTLTAGVWTVPVLIDTQGNPSMPDPLAPDTFKQGMSQYHCAAAAFYSQKNASAYHVFFGGISYGYYDNGVFTTDAEIPFTNQVTTIQQDSNGRFTQYIMPNQYPVIISTQANPGNTLLFGADAYFVMNNISQYYNGIINLDNIRKPTVIGYIVGGIQSTLQNTTTQSDSAASPYIFKVTLVPSA